MSNVLTRKTAIWPRVLAWAGQNLPPPQPPVTPSAARRSTQRANVDGHGTSPKTPEQAGGVYAEPCSALSRKTAICARVTVTSGQKLPPPQPPVIASFASSSIQLAYVDGQGTSANVPAQAGGAYCDPCRPLRMKTAIWARVTASSRQ